VQILICESANLRMVRQLLNRGAAEGVRQPLLLVEHFLRHA
jgi:hypothetical protein